MRQVVILIALLTTGCSLNDVREWAAGVQRNAAQGLAEQEARNAFADWQKADSSGGALVTRPEPPAAAQKAADETTTQPPPQQPQYIFIVPSQ